MGHGSEARDYSEPSYKKIEKKKWTTSQKVGAGFGIAIAAGSSTIGVLEFLEALGVDGPVIAKYVELKTLGIETSKEALDKFTKATGIKIFGAEEKQAVSEVKEAFTGLEIQGLNHVWQNGRWEYVDPNDSLVAGYWDNKEGKFELTANELRGEWKGLFVSQSLGEIEKNSKDSSDLTKTNWEKGVIKIPIPFPITDGAKIEKIKSLIDILSGKPVFIMGINQINQSKFYLPLSPETGEASYGYTAGTYANPDITVSKGSLSLMFNFYKTQQCLIPLNGFPDNPYFRGDKLDLNFTRIALGFPFLEVNNEDVITKSFLNRINPLLKNQYQILMQMYVDGNHPVDFSFDNFFQDSKGRFIYLNPTQPEIDSQVAKQKEKLQKIEEETSTIKSAEPGQLGYETEMIIKTEKAPVIEGLSLNEKTGIYLTEEGVEAGTFKDGILSLSPEFIKSLQNEAQKQGKWLITLPFTPEEAKNMKITEKNVGGKGDTVIVVNLSNNTTIYSPLEAKCLDTWGQELVDFDKNLWQAHKNLEFDLGNNNFLVIKSKDLKFFPHGENVNVGDLLAETNQDIILEFQQRGSDAVIKMGDYIVKIGGVPVFTQSK